MRRSIITPRIVGRRFAGKRRSEEEAGAHAAEEQAILGRRPPEKETPIGRGKSRPVLGRTRGGNSCCFCGGVAPPRRTSCVCRRHAARTANEGGQADGREIPFKAAPTIIRATIGVNDALGGRVAYVTPIFATTRDLSYTTVLTMAIRASIVKIGSKDG